MPRLALLCVFVLLDGVAVAAEADPDAHDPPVAAAVGAGGGVALLTLLSGGVLFASTGDDGLRRTAVYVAMAGLTLAPALAHLMVREYKRAAIFSALPLAALITNVVVFQLDPRVATLGSAGSRTTFGIALTAAILGATVGLVDTFGASDRWRARHRLLVAPSVGAGGGGLTLAGSF
jgi:hypothetical protein